MWNECAYIGNPFSVTSPKVKHLKLSDGPNLAPPKPIQLGQNTRSVPRRELHSLKLAFPIGPNTDSKLTANTIRVLIPPNQGQSPVEIAPSLIGISNREGIRVKRDDPGVGDAEDPLVTAAPRVLDDEVPSEILRLFQRGGGGGDVSSGDGGVHGGGAIGSDGIEEV